MDKVKEHIIRILSEKGVADTAEEYLLKIPRSEMMSELSLLGVNHETAERQLESLCAGGTLVIDELNIYQYEHSPL